MKKPKIDDTLSIWDVNFVVVDVETTGHSPSDNRITEIACITTRGGEITSEFSSLVNPHQFIPPFIAQMTGITNAMVFTAPESQEILANVREVFSAPNTVFVAHNAMFDYGFVNQSLLRCGYQALEIPQFCTLKLARRLLPPSVKKNAGSVAEFFEIEIENRHRAHGDAMATAQFFIEMLDIVQNDYEVKTLGELLHFQNKRLKNFVPTQVFMRRIEQYLDALPEEPGVYSMLDADGTVLYVGKAKSLRGRVRSYFQIGAQHSHKIERMTRLVHEIRWECTDTELAALLLESREIKRLQPPYNTSSKRIRLHPFLRLTVQEEFPRLEWTSSVEKDGAEYFGPFRNRSAAQEIAETMQKRFNLRLCEDEIVPDSDAKPCFYYHIKRCKAPCAQLQTRRDYMVTVEEVRQFLSGYEAGIIERLREEMSESAERLMFERAASIRNRLREFERVFERKENVSTAANNNNVIIILPASQREKTVEIFFIESGRLFHQQILGRKAPLERLLALLQSAYFSIQTPASHRLTALETDEMRIIASWIYRNRESGTFIYTENKSSELVIAEFIQAVRSAFDKFEASFAISA